MAYCFLGLKKQRAFQTYNMDDITLKVLTDYKVWNFPGFFILNMQWPSFLGQIKRNMNQQNLNKSECKHLLVTVLLRYIKIVPPLHKLNGNNGHSR